MARSLYPAPVMVAFFTGGEQIRMSFHQPAGKPWRYATALTMVRQVVGNERARVGWNGFGESPLGKPADDVLCSFVEWDGTVLREPPIAFRGALKAAKRLSNDPARRQVAIIAPNVFAEPVRGRRAGRRTTRKAA